MYKTKNVHINELLLDQQNPRFTTRENKNFTQSEIIEYLIEYEELLELAKKINEYGGFTPGERLIVFKENDKYTVLEGNRRTSSLKLLNNPNLIKKKINNLPKISENCSKFCRSIPVDIVSSREEADIALLTRHIEGIRLWSPFSKMKFYKKMIDNGRSIDNISTMSVEGQIKIKRTLNKYSILTTILDNYSKIVPSSTYLTRTEDTKLDTDLILNRMYSYFISSDGLNLTFSQDSHELILPQNTNKKDQLIKILVLIAKMHWEDKVINTRNLNKQIHIYNFFNGIPITKSTPTPINETHKILLELIDAYKTVITDVSTSTEEEDKSESSNPSNQDENNEDSSNQPNQDENKEDSSNQSNQDENNEDSSNQSNQDENNEDSSNQSNQDENNEGSSNQATGDNGGRNSNSGRPKKSPEEYDSLLKAYPFRNKYRKNKRINTTLVELERLSYKNFGLSANYLIRSLLESYAYEYTKIFSSKDYTDPNKLKGLTINNFPDKDLNEKYVHFLASHIGNINDSYYVTTKHRIITIFDKANRMSITQKLNQFVHSPDFNPTYLENLQSWENVSEILRTMDEVMYNDSGQSK